MQNMQNISPLFFSSKTQIFKIAELEWSINSRTCLGHLVLLCLIMLESPCLEHKRIGASDNKKLWGSDFSILFPRESIDHFSFQSFFGFSSAWDEKAVGADKSSGKWKSLWEKAQKIGTASTKSGLKPKFSRQEHNISSRSSQTLEDFSASERMKVFHNSKSETGTQRQVW